MCAKITLTEDTEVNLDGSSEIQDVHLEDLAFVADIETDGENNVTACTIDVPQLVQMATLYAAMEKKREGWRRMHG